MQQAFQKKKFYTENWEGIRKRVYQRDGHRCVMCGKKGKLHAHHIVPVKISKDNSLNNLVSVCETCHRKLEAVGFRILREGGHQTDIRRVELQMIAEAKKERMIKYKELQEKNNGRDKEED